jgi:secreted trypsin-like serine protease
MKRLALILPILASSAVYAFEPTPYIVNGSPADINNYPSFSSLYFDNGRYYGNYCGSTVINENYILTAAHCIYGDYDTMLHTWIVPKVTNEEGYLNGQYESVRAEEFYYPDNYVDSSALRWPNDIAIIKVSRSLSGSPNYVNRLNFDRSKATLSQTNGYMAIGHGLVNGNVDSNGILLETDLTLIGDSSCGTTDGQLCFDGELIGNYKNSTCNGDSGGPVYADFGTNIGYIQVGITSFGPEECGDRTEPATSAFTDVYHYETWINSVINGGEVPKYHVVTSGTTRQLVENATSQVKASSKHVDGGSSGGGSLGLLSIFALGFLTLRRRFS